MIACLSLEEQQIINSLADVFNQFAELPDHHISDVEEFTQHVHILQRQVMARLARRTHPEIFG